MVEFTLPANSKVVAGKAWPAPAKPSRPRPFRVYRWDPAKSAVAVTKDWVAYDVK